RDVLVDGVCKFEISGTEGDRGWGAVALAVGAHQLDRVDPAAVELADDRFLLADLADRRLQRLHAGVLGVALAGTQPEPAGVHRQDFALEPDLAVLLLEHADEDVDRVADLVQRGAGRAEDREHGVATGRDRPAAPRTGADRVGRDPWLEPLRGAL